jgi:hypothetical protein
LTCDRDEEEETAVKTKTLLKMSAAVIAIPVAFTITAGTAAAGCKSGYVWRDAKDGDGVCVTPGERAEAKAQNANAANNRRPGGGPYGPNTCRDGYVWREAFAGDVVCVTPYERQRTQQQNAANAANTASTGQRPVRFD